MSTWYSLVDNLYGHPLAAEGKKTRRSVSQATLENKPSWECLDVHTRSQLILSVSVDEIKKVGKRKHAWDSCGRLLENKSIWKIRTLRRVKFFFVAPRKKQKLIITLFQQKTDLFRVITTTEVTHEKHKKDNSLNRSHCGDMAGHAETCVERYCERAGTSGFRRRAETVCMMISIFP